MIDETLATVANELFQAHHDNVVEYLRPMLEELMVKAELRAMYSSWFTDQENDRTALGIPINSWEVHTYRRFQVVAIHQQVHIYADNLYGVIHKLQDYFRSFNQPFPQLELLSFTTEGRDSINNCLRPPRLFEMETNAQGKVLSGFYFQA